MSLKPPKKFPGMAWRMDDGPYAFGERAELRLVGSGDHLGLWTGITTINGEPGLDRCLGILPRKFLEQLATEIVRRLRPIPQPAAADIPAASARVRRPRRP